jgi:hypothetical protein
MPLRDDRAEPGRIDSCTTETGGADHRLSGCRGARRAKSRRQDLLRQPAPRTLRSSPDGPAPQQCADDRHQLSARLTERVQGTDFGSDFAPFRLSESPIDVARTCASIGPENIAAVSCSTMPPGCPETREKTHTGLIRWACCIARGHDHDRDIFTSSSIVSSILGVDRGASRAEHARPSGECGGHREGSRGYIAVAGRRTVHRPGREGDPSPLPESAFVRQSPTR